MIPDVPRTPSDPALRGQVLELYRVLAAMRDYIEYQFNVIEDRFRELEDVGGGDVDKIADELEEINAEMRKIERQIRSGTRREVSSVFDWSAFSAEVGFVGKATGSLSQ